MSGSFEPIGAPKAAMVDERTFVGPAGWSLPRRARELAPLLKVEVVAVEQALRRLETREHVVVRARGRSRDLSRYWRRLDEIADAVNASGGEHRWWLRRAIGTLFEVFRS